MSFCPFNNLRDKRTSFPTHIRMPFFWDEFNNFFSVVGLLFIFSCEDITPPSVSITSVAAGSTVNEMVTITADADDNEITQIGLGF